MRAKFLRVTASYLTKGWSCCLMWYYISATGFFSNSNKYTNSSEMVFIKHNQGGVHLTSELEFVVSIWLTSGNMA
jgi:hypothetical protein